MCGKRYDFIVVGAGLTGATIANYLHSHGKEVLVVERRGVVGGNCYTEKINGIDVHKYGAHIFRTDSIDIWNYVNQFCTMNPYNHKVVVKYNNELYSFPINLMTLHKLDKNITTPSDAALYFEMVRGHYENPSNLQEQCINLVGEKLFEIFIKGYTEKQWGKSCDELPASIIKRIPVRITANDNYFDSSKRYQGIPDKGYTKMIENMLNDISIIYNADWCDVETRTVIKGLNLKTGGKIIYTGAIDEYLGKEGSLEWRSLEFVEGYYDKAYYQGASVVNYTQKEIPFTRIIEHRHFNDRQEIGNHTIITKEYPKNWEPGLEKYYPINTKENQNAYNILKDEMPDYYVLAGRLAEYKYYDMEDAIKRGLEIAKSLL